MSSLKPSKYIDLQPFQAWVQQSLPAVYDDSLSYTDLLAKMLAYLNNLVANNNSLSTDVRNAINYINTFFESTDFQEKVDDKLNRMASDGTLSRLIQPLFDVYKEQIDQTVDEYKKQTDQTVAYQNTTISNIQSQQNTLKQRMDTFTQLPSGSTSGDAELQDIRVSANGVTYPNAGDAVRGQYSQLKEDLIKQLDLQELYKHKTVRSVQGYYDADLKGIGTLVSKLPIIITSVEINTEIKGTGSAKLELLDSNKKVIASTTSTYTNKLVFKFNDLYVGNYDELWVRVYSDTLLFARAECDINKIIINTNKNYVAYFNNDSWQYSNQYNYLLLFTLNGKIGNNSVIVGTNEKFNRIIDAVKYCNTRPNYVWNIYIQEGTYDIYNELGGSSWYSGITSAKGNMQGISLSNNVNLIGLGKVTLQFNPSDDLATENNVPNVSVLELSDINNKIENIKIECRNCRYGIHDETDGGKPNSTRYFKNVEITHNGVVSGTWDAPVSYGCGSSDNSKFEYIDCKFNDGWLAHQSNRQTIPPNFIANNCTFNGGSYAISLNTSGTCKANITFNNCEINYMVRVLEDADVWNIYGSGNNLFNYVVIGENKINSQPFKLYDLTRIFKNIGTSKITKGNAVQIYKSGVSNGNEANQVIGIALNDAEPNANVRVQIKGYYDCYSVAPFTENNTLLGVSNGAIIENASNYFGIGVYVDDFQQIYLFQASTGDISQLKEDLDNQRDSLEKSNIINVEAKRTNNLFNKDSAKLGYYNGAGKFIAGRSVYNTEIKDIYASDLIECEPNTIYSTNGALNGNSVTFFDESKNFVSQIKAYNYKITVPNNSSIRYMSVEFYVYTNATSGYRFCHKPDLFMVVEGETIPTKYEPFYLRTVSELQCEEYTPKGVLFDTDWAYDTDDIGAVRLLLWAEREGMIDIVACCLSHYVPEAVGSFDAFCTYEGRKGLPIGIDKTVQWSEGQTGVWHTNMRTHPHTLESINAEDAVRTYRRALAESKKPIDIIVVGTLINVYNLMLSVADDISELNGIELLNKKCNRIWVMGGEYPSGKEANFDSTARACEKTQYVVSKSTVPMTFLGVEAGRIRIGSTITDRVNYDPFAKAMQDANKIAEDGTANSLAWDILLTWIACVGDAEACGFNIIKGTNTVYADGSNVFTTDNVGHHQYVVKNHPNEWYQNEMNTIMERIAWTSRELGGQQIKRITV